MLSSLNRWLLGAIFSFCFSSIQAQFTQYHTDPFSALQKGKELLSAKQFLPAQEQFQQVIKSRPYYNDNKYTAWLAEATYSNAYCALALNQPGADALMMNFVTNYPNSVKTNDANFQIAKYFFFKSNFSEVIRRMEKINTDLLDSHDINDGKFYLAYAYFFTKKYDKAKPLFVSLAANDKNSYAVEARYYSGFILFNEKKYTDAETYFNRVVHEPQYQNIVPYYLCQIYYSTGRLSQLIAYGPTLLEKKGIQNQTEIQRLIGLAYYDQTDYENALPYLESFSKTQGQLNKNDLYKLAFTQFETKHYQDAIDNLKDLNVMKDSMGQHSLYLLADAYLHIGNKSNARNAFQEASRMEFDAAIKESSEFNYAKLSFEQGLHQSAINSFTEFLTSYPNSKLKTEAQELLTDLYLSTNNFREALKMVEAISNKSPRLKEAYQKIAFSRGVELFNDKNYSDALLLFGKSNTYPVSTAIVAQAAYWSGEASYRQNKYRDAIDYYGRFLDAAKETDLELLANVSVINANYNSAYCFLNLKQHENALPYFLKCKLGSGSTPKVAADATLRSADCFFMMKEYEKAMKNYNEVIDAKAPGADYALYQRGLIEGLTGEWKDKIETLEQLAQRYPKSIYLDDAKYEVANTYFSKEKFDEALRAYTEVTANFPKSPFYKNSYLKQALIYMNTDENDKAIYAYKQVINNFPNTPEASEAVMGLKNAYVEKGDSKSFLDYIKTNADVSITASAEDSITFQAAENNFNKENFVEALAAFDDYINQYPKGLFSTPSHFYRAECNVKKEKWITALNDYKYVIENNAGRFTERSLNQAAKLSYFKVKDYSNAFKYYQQLIEISEYKNVVFESQKGAMRSAYFAGDDENTKIYAQKVLVNETAQSVDTREANFYIGKAAFRQNEYGTARTTLSKCISGSKNADAAEARYLLAKMDFAEQKYDKAEKGCYDVINQTPSYDKWVGNSLLLLADVYTATKEYFQAKATLETLKENLKDENFQAQANEKLNAIRILEKDKSKLVDETPTNNTAPNDTLK